MNIIETLFGKILKERPANVIYCELDGKLYGIISMGNVARAGKESRKAVNINKKFTSVKPNQYMKVKQMFKENENINAVPVIDEYGKLLGDYIRWDDLFVLEYLNLLNGHTEYVVFCNLFSMLWAIHWNRSWLLAARA